jgi:hydroxymethylglutaryl-CoA synthase
MWEAQARQQQYTYWEHEVLGRLTAGIVGYGVYIPRLRIKREEYQKSWGYFAPRWLEEKSVADFDEDPVTMAVEAASNALHNTGRDASQIDAVYFASTSPSYSEKQSAGTVATALGCRRDTCTLDVSSSTMGGVSALLSGLDYVSSLRGKTSLIVASDSPSADPTGSLDHQLAAAAAAVIVGRDQVNGVVEGSYSVTSESFGERFRRDGSRFVATMDLGRYHDSTFEDTMRSCAVGLMQSLGRRPQDYDFFALMGTDPGRAVDIAKKLGFEETKASAFASLGKIGDAGAATPLLALSKLLELSSFKQHVLLCAYGPGSGATALSVVVDGEMKSVPGLSLDDYLSRKNYIDYPSYLRVRRFLTP